VQIAEDLSRAITPLKLLLNLPPPLVLKRNAFNAPLSFHRGKRVLSNLYAARRIFIH